DGLLLAVDGEGEVEREYGIVVMNFDVANVIRLSHIPGFAAVATPWSLLEHA
ncbi:unnamed protein product, partial [Musa acuminata subsp. burmannicoides]